MAAHSSTLAWKIPWMEEPGRLQSMGSLRVGHDWATSLSLSLSYIGEGNGHPLQCSCLENLGDGGAWWAAVYGVAQSRTRLTQLSSSSNPISIYLISSSFKERLYKTHSPYWSVEARSKHCMDSPCFLGKALVHSRSSSGAGLGGPPRCWRWSAEVDLSHPAGGPLEYGRKCQSDTSHSCLVS